MSNFVITFTPYFKKNVEKELKKIDSTVIFEKFFDESNVLISSNKKQTEFLNELSKNGSIFIKHICPAEKSGEIIGDLGQDKKTILSQMIKDGYKVCDGEKFAIQTRILKGGEKGKPLDYSSKDIDVFVGTYFTEKGGVPTFYDRTITSEDDVKIFSILINEKTFYLGNSTAIQNLNFACDEYRTSSKSGGREISRAENKLKEALVKYKIDLGENGGIALDIGAAPGGWTKVLVDHGYNVVAVDPGELKSSLQNNPKIKHYKCRIEELKFENYFDIIVNDMNVEPQTTAEIMNSLSSCLKKNGLAIVTLKLFSRPDKGIEEACGIFSQKYIVKSINNLFHNRQEVTVLIEKKNE